MPACAMNYRRWQAQGPVHRKAFSEAWLAFLRHELPLRQYKVRSKAAVSAPSWVALFAST